MKYSFYLTLFAAATLLLPSCNKDENIEIDNPEDGAVMRPASDGSSRLASKVFEYTPAPGQFINETASGAGNLSDMTQACQWAQTRLDNNLYVSLGAFGGYIVVGFDHSIPATGGYDFGVAGNSFFNEGPRTGSNEPGIVYVMQDTNRNGLPDDQWYELRGSEWGSSDNILDYSVTYYRPEAPASAVRWTDNLGNSGTVDYHSAFHAQDFYYPLWISADKYTLTGTLLPSNVSQNPDNGNWSTAPFSWGYADNYGSDNTGIDAYVQCNRFRISDAVDAEGKAVKLDFIDFVKVQTGVNAKAGWVGEISTEVCGFIDLSL